MGTAIGVFWLGFLVGVVVMMAIVLFTLDK